MNVNVVLHDLDLHFQGQTFCCYEFVIKKLRMQQMSPADLFGVFGVYDDTRIYLLVFKTENIIQMSDGKEVDIVNC